MNLQIGKAALLSLDNWFYAPNGVAYRAVFGTVRAVRTAEDTLGVRTNAKSTNWYVEIGCMTVAGCQIHYAVRTDACDFSRVTDWSTHEGKCSEYIRPTAIFNADLAVVPSVQSV